MAEEGEPSFSRLVFGKAVSDTARFLAYTKRDLIFGVITVALGAGLAWYFVGKADTMKEMVFFAAFTVAPAGIVMIAVFIWHLWLAPAALAYEVYKGGSASAVGPDPEVNLTPMRLRAVWDVPSFAEVLRAVDPKARTPGHRFSYKVTILDALKHRGLKYIRVASHRVQGGYYPPSDSSEIAKEDAIEWAEKNGFDMSKVK